MLQKSEFNALTIASFQSHKIFLCDPKKLLVSLRGGGGIQKYNFYKQDHIFCDCFKV